MEEAVPSVDEHEQVAHSEDELAPSVDVHELADEVPLEKTAQFALVVQNTDPSQIAAQTVDAVIHSVDLGELVLVQL